MNFGSKTAIPTWPGLIVTLILYVIVGGYTVLRLKKLINRESPTVTSELALNTYTAQ